MHVTEAEIDEEHAKELETLRQEMQEKLKQDLSTNKEMMMTDLQKHGSLIIYVMLVWCGNFFQNYIL